MNDDKPSTRLVSIRVEEEIKSKLENIASNSDRSITQLCRYALASYTASGSPQLEEPSNADDTRLTEVIGIRLPLDVIEELPQFGTDTSLSMTLRSVLGWWLNNADFTQLGGPSTSWTGAQNAK